MSTTISRFVSSISLAGMVVLSTVGCMVTPGNQEEIASRSAPITFSGFTVNPGQKVKIYVQNKTNQGWTYLGETTSRTEAVQHFGKSWHHWNKDIVVPKNLWQEFGVLNPSYFVVLKAVADGNDLFSFEKGFYDYVGDYDSVEDLYNEKGSPDGVRVLVFTTKP